MLECVFEYMYNIHICTYVYYHYISLFVVILYQMSYEVLLAVEKTQVCLVDYLYPMD